MTKFLIEASLTAEGAKGLLKEGGTSRKKTVETMINQMGGTLEAFYFAFGKTDVYVICELPDQTSAASVSLTINATGLVSTSTIILLDPNEIDQATKKSVNYRGPGQ